MRVTRNHEHLRFDNCVPQSAFVPCDLIAYFPEGRVAYYGPSFSVWMVPGTLEGDVVAPSNGAVAVGYFADFYGLGDKTCVRFSDEIGRKYGAKGSIVEAGPTVCSTMRRPSDSFTIVPGTAS